MSLAAVLRASNPSQSNTVTKIRYSSRNSTAAIMSLSQGCNETPGHHKGASSGTVQGAPHLVHVVRVYRRYWVVWCGIWWVGVRQFLDLGSGLPTAGNVHEVAQDLKPGCRVVYVDRLGDCGGKR